ncbi:MAG TPA: hypothetical protein VFD13_03365 [Candidatus Kapabacteria bacterium]|nr:hypothetical protein [Candidatus Kapabacteria bacterium]
MKKLQVYVLLSCAAGIVGCSHLPEKEKSTPIDANTSHVSFQSAPEDRRYRWDVKTLQDAAADWLDKLGMPWQHNMTISKMVNMWKCPKEMSDTSSRYSDPKGYRDEANVVNLEATIKEYIQEGDGDIHLVLTDGSNDMIAEVPNPDSTTNRYGVRKDCRAVRDWLHNYLGEPAMWLPNHELSHHPKDVGKVVVVGVPFFDKPHNQLGVAPNGIEIHPVLGISFQGQN